MDRKGSRWATAYHEAGHAVAAMQLGVGIGRRGVSIIPGEDFAGFAHVLKGFRGRPDLDLITGAMRLKAENRVIVSFAGPAAQRRFRASSVRSYHGRSDRERAIDLLIFFASPTRELEAYLRWLHIRTENLVAGQAWWLMIEAVAEALMTHKRLTSEEVEAVVRKALGWPEELLKKLDAIGKG